MIERNLNVKQTHTLSKNFKILIYNPNAEVVNPGCDNGLKLTDSCQYHLYFEKIKSNTQK